MRVSSQHIELHMNCGLRARVCECEGGGWSCIPTILSYDEVKVSICEQKNLHVSLTRDQTQNFLNENLLVYPGNNRSPTLVNSIRSCMIFALFSSVGYGAMTGVMVASIIS